MNNTIDGFYSAYLTGKAGAGFAVFILRKGQIVGAGPPGGSFDGSYVEVGDNMFEIEIISKLPPNCSKIQGGVTGPEGESGKLNFALPRNFTSLEFVRVDTEQGPINVKLVKLRDLDE